jgi:hypothetical protein
LHVQRIRRFVRWPVGPPNKKGSVASPNVWSGRRVSNSRPQPWQGCALPTELLPHGAANNVLLLRHYLMPYAKASHKTLLQKSGAGDESRTRDLNLGKVALYQLSYSRVLLLSTAYLPLNYNLFANYCTPTQTCVHRRNEIMYKALKRVNPFDAGLLRVNGLSGSVARHLSGS